MAYFTPLAASLVGATSTASLTLALAVLSAGFSQEVKINAVADNTINDVVFMF
jgi:hypothetical protein